MSEMAKKWTAAEMPSQAGRRALITGANSGIGYYAALELARKRAHVVMACRDRTKGDAARSRLLAAVPGASVEVTVLDLASLASVRALAEAELARGEGLDLLINNAGVMAPKRRLETVDGFEVQFGTNVLGHFLLTALLLPALERAGERGPQRARVVTLASIAHKRGRIHFDDLQATQRYSPMESYSQSKLADLMFAFELERRLRAAGGAAAGVISVAAHPGVANTNLFQVGEFSAFERAARRWVGVAIGALLNTEADGALPTLYAATSPDAVGGGYYGPQGWLEMRGGDAGPAQVAKQARDQAVATRLWEACEEMIGLQFL
jgi:NAD(P)-dependent dehydrogenase (short-subunit alcohol dehydrogenase family)